MRLLDKIDSKAFLTYNLKTMKQQFVRIIVAILLVSSGIHAQTQQNQSAISLEVDPAPFIPGGYSISLKFSPRTSNHITIMGSGYSSGLPDKMMSKSNYEKDSGILKLKPVTRSLSIILLTRREQAFMPDHRCSSIPNRWQAILTRRDKASRVFIPI
ncbi:MAG: hypothetical protein IPL27_01290 [Lewinellaceae bacterium]|nr:hypothetical protein [Lewinellaceae bacterium]